MNKDMPARWALDRAAKLTSRGSWKDAMRLSVDERFAIIAHARTIEKREQPPVDPDVLAVREMLAAWYGESPTIVKEAEGGVYDNDRYFQAALADYRRVKYGGVS